MTFLTQLNWRHATKAFDPQKKVGDADLDKILEAIHMAPTSFGLQPFYVRVVKDEGLKQTMQAAGWGQAQFPTATAILVFIARSDAKARIEEMMTSRSGGDAAKRAQFKDYEGMMTGWAGGMTEDGLKVWAQKQAYIAMGFGLAAAAELGVSSCPMEGFGAGEFDAMLALPKGHYSTVVLAIGHEAAGGNPFPKWRFSKGDVIREGR